MSYIKRYLLKTNLVSFNELDVENNGKEHTSLLVGLPAP